MSPKASILPCVCGLGACVSPQLCAFFLVFVDLTVLFLRAGLWLLVLTRRAYTIMLYIT